MLRTLRIYGPAVLGVHVKNFCKRLALLAFSLGLQAGTATFVGHGMSIRDPEFITVEISVDSECYATPSDAMRANNKTTTEIQAFLKDLLIDNNIDTVRIQGGVTSPSTRTVYVDNQSKSLCPGKFDQRTSVSFKTAHVKAFSETFARIQEKVLSGYTQASESDGAARTFASIGRPHAGVCQETSRLMALEATKHAFAHARAQFDAVATGCGIKEGELTNFGDVEQTNYSRKSNGPEAMFSPDSDVVSLSFDPLSESRIISASFTYEKTTFTCNLGQ